MRPCKGLPNSLVQLLHSLQYEAGYERPGACGAHWTFCGSWVSSARPAILKSSQAAMSTYARACSCASACRDQAVFVTQRFCRELPKTGRSWSTHLSASTPQKMPSSPSLRAEGNPSHWAWAVSSSQTAYRMTFQYSAVPASLLSRSHAHPSTAPGRHASANP